MTTNERLHPCSTILDCRSVAGCGHVLDRAWDQSGDGAGIGEGGESGCPFALGVVTGAQCGASITGAGAQTGPEEMLPELRSE